MTGNEVALTFPGSVRATSRLVAGLPAQDRVSLENQGTGAGRIGGKGSPVTFGGVGRASGGAGATCQLGFPAHPPPPRRSGR